MNWIQPLAFLLTLALAGAASSGEISAKEPRWKQLSQAYGFVVAQQTSLELIEREFPDLAKDVKGAWFAFNSTALGESVKGVEAELARLLGQDWSKYNNDLTAQIDTLITGQDVTRQQAVAFLQEVRQRAIGELPESILATLLSAHTRFARNPGLELLEGWKQTFRTRGHPKAKGVDFSIAFPLSWSRREGNRPNVIQFFQSGAGHGPIMSSLMVRDIPLPAGYELSERELREFFHPNELRHMVPHGGEFIDARAISLEGAPAGILVSDQTIERLDMTVTTRMTQFVTIQEKSMIFFQFMINKLPDSNESLDELHKNQFPTYRAIVNTFVLNDSYR